MKDYTKSTGPDQSKAAGRHHPDLFMVQKIRTDSNFWTSFEEYLSDYGDHSFTHGICPECMEKHYPELIEADNPTE